MKVRENEGNFTPAPQGFFPAVCCDIVDRGIQDGPFGPKHKVEIWWQLSEKDPATGKPFLARRRYNAGLGSSTKPSDLRRDLETWRNRPFTKEEAADFDLDVLLTKNCQLQIVHKIKDGGTFANVTMVAPPTKGATPLVVAGYTRVATAPAAAAGNGGTPAAGDDDDDDVPF
ncbi:MAG: hypothetical protein PHS14_04910 [Elusimicrobia bacterium]|nr:hypothetical protein [Elusimicrobiota bacterium]